MISLDLGAVGNCSMASLIDRRFWDEHLPHQGDKELYQQIGVVGNEAQRATLTADSGLWEHREREEVHTLSAMCWAARHRLGSVIRCGEADDLGKPSNAFLLCTYWYIAALASVGRRPEALELFNNLLARRNHVGLLSEDIDPQTGELWGNFPQTYSQVRLILSAMRLSRSWEEGLWHAS